MQKSDRLGVQPQINNSLEERPLASRLAHVAELEIFVADGAETLDAVRRCERADVFLVVLVRGQNHGFLCRAALVLDYGRSNAVNVRFVPHRDAEADFPVNGTR